MSSDSFTFARDKNSAAESRAVLLITGTRLQTTDLSFQTTELTLQMTDLILQITELTLQMTDLILQMTELTLQTTELPLQMTGALLHRHTARLMPADIISFLI